MKKKFIFILSLILILSLSLSISAKTEVEFWGWWLGTFEDYLNEMASEFEAENPDIEIKFNNVDGNMAQVLVTAINAGEAPDVVNLNNPTAYTFYQQGALEPLDLHFDGPVGDEYIDALWEKTMFDGFFGYTFPWYASPQIMIYNKEIFESAGLDPEDPPENWEDVMEYSRAIKEETGIPGFAIDIKPWELIQRVGVDLFNDDLSEVAFNVQEVYDRVQYFRTAHEEGLIPGDLPTYQEARSLFEAGELAMYPVGVSMVLHIENNSPELADKIGFGKYPVSPGGADKIHSGMMNLVVLDESENKEAAAKWAHFLTSHKAQIEFSKEATIVPSTKIGLDTDPFFKNADTMALQAQTLASQSMVNVHNLDVTAAPEGWDEIMGIMEEEFEKAIRGDVGVQEMLDFVEERANDIIEDLN
ncbi:ABC transporter substrate-binding protein [Natronospora cellulosivora (SeqCode)]